MHPSMDRWPRCTLCGREDGPTYAEGWGPQVCRPCCRERTALALDALDARTIVAIAIAFDEPCPTHPGFTVPCLLCRLEGGAL